MKQKEWMHEAKIEKKLASFSIILIFLFNTPFGFIYNHFSLLSFKIMSVYMGL